MTEISLVDLIHELRPALPDRIIAGKADLYEPIACMHTCMKNAIPLFTYMESGPGLNSQDPGAAECEATGTQV